MVDKIVGINEKHMQIISDAIHFAHPDLSNLDIETSDSIEDPFGDIVTSIDNKFWGDVEHFQLTDDELHLACDSLFEYRDYLNSIKSVAKKGSANHKRIHSTLKEIPKIFATVFADVKIFYSESEQ